MANSDILIYAELLANIRQITVTAALPSSSDPSTRVELSLDGQQITLHHDGKTSVLSLPGQVAPNIPLQNPVLGRKELSWRLPLAGQPTRGDAESNEAPWPATNLGIGFEFLCRSCSAVIVRKGTIRIWKDLPSENWAEMMDFWHCHKPDHEPNGTNRHYHNDELAASRGYGANTKFTAQTTIGFVDLTTLLLAQSDCIGIQVSYTLFFEPKFYYKLLRFYKAGVKKVAIPASAIRWPGHRYKYPKLTPCFQTVSTAADLAYPLLRTMGYLIDWRIFLGIALRIFLKILEGHGISTRDIYVV
jgi:hypothetical protein